MNTSSMTSEVQLLASNTIDLFKPNGRAMRLWGVRDVTIEILEWGRPRKVSKF